MKRPDSLRHVVRIAKYTLLDEVRQRSLIVVFVICALAVFLARGCYQGNYVVNGQALDAGTIAGAVSKAAFHVIAVVAMLIAALLSMRAFRRDRDGGMQSSILSKPITRQQYVLGKVAGLWVLSAVFMLVLQAIIFLAAAVTAHVVMPGYVAASLLCSLNLLFVVIAVLLFIAPHARDSGFSLLLGIAVVGLIVDGANALGASRIALTMAGATQTGPFVEEDPLLRLAEALRDAVFRLFLHRQRRLPGAFVALSLFNILVYSFLLGALLFWRFRKERDSLGFLSIRGRLMHVSQEKCR